MTTPALKKQWSQEALTSLDMSMDVLCDRFAIPRPAPKTPVEYGRDPELRDVFRLQAIAGVLAGVVSATEPTPEPAPEPQAAPPPKPAPAKASTATRKGAK